MRRIVALLLIGLTSLALDFAHAQAVSAPSIDDDCQLACADECSWMRPRKCRRTMRKCVRRGPGVCGGLPTFAVFNGTWGYAASFVAYAGCPTTWPLDLGGTLTWNVSAQGAITGSSGSGVPIAGSFTSATSASLVSAVFADVYGCYTLVEADLAGMTPTSGALSLYLSQECTPGVICTAGYSGDIAR